jgi:hypothetical protein
VVLRALSIINHVDMVTVARRSVNNHDVMNIVISGSGCACSGCPFANVDF